MDDASYKVHADKRAEHSQKVIDSDSRKRLVMAGPGTGKSFLFQQVAKKLKKENRNKILVLTFINELVKDLSVDMHGLAEVSTLHSYAAKKLRSNQSICMNLMAVIEQDYSKEFDQDLGYSLTEALSNLDIDDKQAGLDYLGTRRGYYKAYDATMIVYDLVKLYESDTNAIPEYDLIMIDEFQDFNELEAKLIELLASKSPVLIAGDDDQSLYSFKHSRPDKIRSLHNDDDYETFELPYCSRSTSVVIDAFHDFLNKAQENGHLTTRIPKQYLYFPDEKKDRYSSLYPKIEVRKRVYDLQNAYMIDRAIKTIFEIEPSFDVLIICPLKKQINRLAEALRKKGYSNVTGDSSSNDTNTLLLLGLRILFDDKDSNLGWRLAAEAVLDDDPFTEAVKKSSDLSTSFKDCLPNTTIALIKKLRALTVKVQNGDVITNDEDRNLLFSNLGIDANSLGEKFAKGLIFNNSYSTDVHQAVKIKITTILGSKGLSYDYVFLINFDDTYLLPRSGDIDDESINKFLVALTRSRKKVSIYTSKTTEPVFVDWISVERKEVF